MKRTKIIYKIATVWIALFVIAAASAAQDFKVEKTGNTLELLEDRDQNGVVIANKKSEPSGVEPIGSGKYLLAANDKDNDDGLSLKIIEASTGKVIKTLAENLQNSKKNPKWEALAKDAEGNFYVIGSHNDESDAAKLATRSRMFRFRLSSEWEENPLNFSIDTASVRELNVKDSFAKLGIYDADPKKNKLKIEGLEVRGIGCRKELLIGLREDPLKANMVRVYAGELPDSEAAQTIVNVSVKPFFKFAAGKPQSSPTTEFFKLSSLEYVEKLKGFLIVTSTEDTKNKFHGNALWFIGDAQTAAIKLDKTDGFKAVSLKNIYEFEPEMKAEGLSLLPFANSNKIKLAIVFDNDAIKHGALQILELTDNRK